jgi:protein involved in polysaccharide export with SLBB domain
MFTRNLKVKESIKTHSSSTFAKSTFVLVAMLLTSLSTGCTALTSPIKGVPARRLPPQFFATPKNNLVPIDISRLSQEPPREYLLEKGDILGIYIEGILPSSDPDQVPTLPPVHFPEKDSTLPPSLGYPVPVVEDGTISLPLIKPLSVAGLTVQQVRDLIRRAYFDSQILNDTQLRVFTPIVSLLQERSVNIVVVREDSEGGALQGAGARGGNYIAGSSDKSASGSAIRLKAYQNDVLHALMETGGLPGLNAKNEVKILRANRADQRKRDEFIKQFYATFYSANQSNPCVCPPPLPDDPSIIRIPLRLPPGVTPSFRPEDIVLQEGDIVYIESRDQEVFYTGGLLPGGEWKIPRDYDLDVLGAMAIAGRGVASSSGQGGGGLGGGVAGGIGGVPPGNLYILRKTPCNGQVTIHVDLARAMNNPQERPLIQPGDILILQYKCEEELLNFGLGSFFTFGIQQLFNGN